MGIRNASRFPKMKPCPMTKIWRGEGATFWLQLPRVHQNKVFEEEEGKGADQRLCTAVSVPPETE